MYGSFYRPDAPNIPKTEVQKEERLYSPGGERLCTCKDDDPPYKILVNTLERRLYLYQSDKLLKSYPVAIGKPSTPTPKGTFKIKNKDPNPNKPVFGAGWMGLTKPHYGIHGTNNPASIGTAVSDGCIRMYNKDLLELFYKIPIGTEVKII